MEKTSRVSGFFKKTPEERLEFVKSFSELTDEEASAIMGEGATLADLDRMVENVIGWIEVPLGVALNFLINGKDYIIPMAIEEPSVIAAASNAARMAREGGGFRTCSSEPLMIGQIQIVDLRDPFSARFEILRERDRIIELANKEDPILVSLGGGAKDLKVRVVEGERGANLVVHLLVDCRDAMGANAVNTMAERVAPVLEEITGGKAILRIVSNLADQRIAMARARFLKEVIGGEEVVDRIIDAYMLARYDPYRAATHNKGIMNGVTAVVLATGNDTRAVEAGAHAYAARGGSYLPLTRWEKDENGDLVGTIEMPVAVGLVGGATRSHPVARAVIKILGVRTARELSEVIAAVGLAQNFAALRALATEGIQRGHMRLHAKNIAIAAGATGDEIERVVDTMVREGVIRLDRAREILDGLRLSS
ncbi:MAG TPA: hydroxymethylglutaryl-CoA reductase, degradative [Candidatus Syntrophoarchaeum butanivorans]|uniref:3-hydroxy-3-methylglutaryl coenzyme A reductase n=3 Tax=Candidatus Syntropharchaeum butanivorans TaxID=1839936 RepID=A0A1F2P455_9EURY|nr:MAG: Hydroxymethylglutaryl-CoA reductase, class II and archaeal class I [Candidatus Syntrophoarchaeum butanivorans]RJS73072.1 MAG: hydroxymethylglutaryl-CoA reductase, degradative [Candidatus Syntrophoarchaeum sp. WYZ-LMO15]HEC56456.1 hydroxymethylglutaryl-CoA reductase, degradative [Candidatus Syntrophoarchaeum butanivorans]